MISTGPIERHEVGVAASLVEAGSFTPEAENPLDEEAYWRAVLATRATGGDVVVARDGADVVGVVQVMVLTHFQHRGSICVELESFHVRSDRRSQGIGTLLLADAENLSRRVGAYRVQLTSNLARLDAHRFSLREGYTHGHGGFKKLLEG